jgi:hypothetical protein
MASPSGVKHKKSIRFGGEFSYQINVLFFVKKKKDLIRYGPD